MKRKGQVLGIVLLTLSLIATGFAVPTRAQDEPSGKLIWMMQGSVLADFDPTNHDHLGMLWSEINVYDRLIEVNPQNEFEPGLATEWKRIDDKTIELKLRQGVKFHDGTDFTAEDVKAAYERLSGPDAGRPVGWRGGHHHQARTRTGRTD
jgi:peptide/nickel transport system substrate-binding protein